MEFKHPVHSNIFAGRLEFTCTVVQESLLRPLPRMELNQFSTMSWLKWLVSTKQNLHISKRFRHTACKELQVKISPSLNGKVCLILFLSFLDPNCHYSLILQLQYPHGLLCADVPLRNCSLTESILKWRKMYIPTVYITVTWYSGKITNMPLSCGKHKHFAAKLVALAASNVGCKLLAPRQNPMFSDLRG